MIPYGKHYIDEADIQSVVDVLRGKNLTQGPKVREFERAFADYVGVKYSVAVSSGTAALHLSALVAGMKSKLKLLTSPITFVSTPNAAQFCGGIAEFIDIIPDTVNISADCLIESLSTDDHIHIVAPVHFAGLPCDMETIASVCREHKKIIIEDAAHALGSKYACGSKVGSCKYSDLTIFSFHPVKSIAAGEGGMITTNNFDYYRQLLRLRSHGINKENDPFISKVNSQTNGVTNPWYYEMLELGYHYRLTDIQSALGLSQLSKLDLFVKRRQELSLRYDTAFTQFDNIVSAQHDFFNYSSRHLYVIRIAFNKIQLTRAELMLKLREYGIICQVHYLPVPLHPYYSSANNSMLNFPNAQKYYEECLSIPLYYTLSFEDQDKVISLLRQYVG